MDKRHYCFINEKLTGSSHISYHDRGFRFGDGLFETISIENYKPYLLDYHMERLAEGLAILRITTDIEIIKKRLLILIDHNNHKHGLARIIVSRGIGSRGYLPYKCSQPTVIIETSIVPPSDNRPVNICISTLEKPSPKSLPTGVKLLQGLNSTLVKIEAKERGYFDGILLNQYQQVCEVSSGNIFWLKDKTLYTPADECSLVKGIMRRRIMEIFSVKTGKFSTKELLEADEVFITNVSWIALAVNKIEDFSFNSNKFAQYLREQILLEKNSV